MKKIILILSFLLASSNAFAATSVTSYAITWYFDADYPVGQYVTGDYYVVAPNGMQVTRISPDGSGTDSHGSMINPTPGRNQGYTSAGTYYVRALNASYSVPVSLSPGDSLVSTVTKEVYQSHVSDASVLTVVSTAPPAGSLRPPYCGTSKPVHNISEINWAALATLTPAGTPPTQDAIERSVDRPWVNHSDGAGGSWVIPGNNMPTYGRDMVTRHAQIGLWLNLNYSQAVKQKTLYEYIQIGLDYYYQMIMPGAKRIYAPDGGVNGGQKLAILFAGKVLNNATMLSTIQNRTGDYINEGSVSATGSWTVPSDYIHFQLDGQTFYVEQKDIDITNSGYWNPKDSSCGDVPYTSAHFGMPEWSIRYADTISQSNADWTTYYRTSASFDEAAGIALTAYIMGLKETWNHDALFDFVDRYMAIANGDPDPFGYTVTCARSGHGPIAFVQAMWDAYRGNLNSESGPFRSDKQPSITLPSGTTETTMSLSTRVDSTCKYGTDANTAYGSIANTFSTTGRTSHSQSLTGLTNGSSTTYYVRCNDGTNSNTSDFAITVAVSDSSSEIQAFSWQQPTASVKEGENLTATITRSVSTGPATVEWGTHHDTAINEVDYVGVVWTTQARFADGESTTIVQLETIDNSQLNAERRLTIELQNPSTGTISNSTLAVTIIDDEGRLKDPEGLIAIPPSQ